MAEPQQAAVAPQENIQQHSPFRHVAKLILHAITIPYRRAFKLYTWQPIRDIRMAHGNRTLLISLIKGWKKDKYAEIQSVQVAVSLLKRPSSITQRLAYLSKADGNCYRLRSAEVRRSRDFLGLVLKRFYGLRMRYGSRL